MIGDRVRHARELTGLTQLDLAMRCAVSQSTIAMIERDALNPSRDLLEKVGAATGFPPLFFLSTPDWDFPLGSLAYRKFSRAKSHEKIRAHRYAQQAFEIYEFLATKVATPRVAFGKLNGEEPVTAARITRSNLGFSASEPARSLVERFERGGVRLFYLPSIIQCEESTEVTDVHDLDGFSTWVAGEKPVIAVNASKPFDRIRMTLAHELGHLVLHHPTRSDRDIEEEAFEFASEFLIPESAFRTEIGHPVSLAGIAEMKARWGVSISAIVYRAHKLGIITDRQQKYLRMQIAKRGWRQDEPVSIPKEHPKALRVMTKLAYGENTKASPALSDEAHLPLFWVSRILSSQESGKHDLGKSGEVVQLRKTTS